MPACLRITGRTVQCWNPRGELTWAFESDNLILLAEYTTDQGPAEDYFLLFVVAQEGKRLGLQAPLTAESYDTLLELSIQLNAKLRPTLMNSTDWNSRVLWPPLFKDAPYFVSAELPATTALAKLRRLIFGAPIEHTPEPTIEAFLDAEMHRRQTGISTTRP